MTTDQQLETLRSQLKNADITKRFKNIIVSREGAYVMVTNFGEQAAVKAHTPLVWFLPGLLLAMVAISQFRTNTLWTIILCLVGTFIGGMLYAILKKREIMQLKQEVRKVLDVQ